MISSINRRNSLTAIFLWQIDLEIEKMADLKEIAKWLVVIGGILGLLEGILTILGFGIFGGGIFLLDGLIMGIIAIVLALIALATSGIVDIKALKFEFNWIVLIILGILMYIFGSGLGGILIIIGAILMLVK